MNGTRRLDVVKMHGTENVFVLFDERPAQTERYPELARTLCSAGGELGGADGLLVVRDAPGFAAEMAIYNADGSEAEMCGNGVRCVARYLAERGAGDAFTIKTLAGPIGVEIASREPAFSARVDVGTVTFPRACAPETVAALGEVWTMHEVGVGNPHAVIFCEEPSSIDLEALGKAFARNARFPDGTNLHLVRVADEQTIEVRHYERGVGLTQACGTGAVASAAAAVVARGVRSPVAVRVPGGELTVAWAPGGAARLTGAAETLFSRSIEV